MTNSSARAKAKGLYKLAVQQGIYDDSNGYIDVINGMWVAIVGGYCG